MRIPKTLKQDILYQYKAMAYLLYKSHPDIPAHQIRLMIQQVITEHTTSKSLETITTAKRLTKNKITRKINQLKFQEQYPKNKEIPAKECSF